MRLEDPPNHLELVVVRYEFGGVRGDRFDDNWLVVQGDVRAGDLRWSFEEPCLLVGEARELGRWLRHVTNPDAEWEPLGFTEPCLSLDVVERSATQVQVQVALDHEAAPSGADRSRREPLALNLRLPIGDLIAAGDAWLDHLARFPER